MADSSEAVGDVTAKLNAAQISPEVTSKNAQKKAEKQARMAEKKANASATNTVKEAGAAGAKKATPAKSKKKIDDAKLIGIDVAKEDDFPTWYQQVLTKGDMLDYYDVSGCYILLPASYHIWETIQAWFNVKIKGIGVKNCSFPLFVSEDVLTKEKDHIEGFAAEVAWVTHAGNTKLDKKIAIRPTSETVMYPYYAKWIRSHRDLPLRLNQWNSVVRWEFKHPQPFLRSREFLWQEGHTAHLTREGATTEVRQILEFYAGVYEELLAVPIVRGTKTKKEKFAGSDYSTTCEGYIPSTGRGIQGATSHHLGQNFSKMFGITVEDPDVKDKEGEKKPAINVYQNSWGLSTRVIGVMTMIHSDNHGLVLPPRVAEIQVVLIPVGITAKTTEEQRGSMYKQTEAMEELLKAVGVRAYSDFREQSPGWKFNEWEMKGVPLRLSFGPKEAENHIVETTRRDNGAKGTIKIDELQSEVPKLLETIQADLYNRADEQFTSHRIKVTEWKDFVPALNKKNLILMPSCLEEDCEDLIKEMSAQSPEGDDGAAQDARAPSMGAKSLCIPFEQPEGIEKGVTKCTREGCKRLAEAWCMYGRSY